MFTWCRKRKADIIFLQETHSTIKTDTQWKNEWGADIITSHGSSNARGVSILIKNGFDCTIHQKILDPLGRFIILKADIKDKTYVLINVYAPNKDKDIVYVNNVTEMLPVWTAEGRKELSDSRNVWDWIKYNIRVHAINYSKRKAKERNATELNLQDELKKAKQEFETTPSDSNATRFNAAQENLETFYEEKTKGIIIRVRARWHEHGEKSTKYFLNLEKRNHIKKHIRKLHISGVIKTDPFCILKEQERFYKNLYKSSRTDPDIALKISSFLNDLNIPTLSEDQKNICEGKISAEECYRLLDSFDINKTPGIDGIPIEFYKIFWPLISDSFINCIHECFEKGKMSSSQKQAIITLIEKKGKDRSFLENWRPISLVNVDTKIMTKAIASRIKNVLPDIIHPNETGYVKDRYIGETIRSIYAVMDFTVKENIPGLMLFIDLQKAFDSVEWDFLFKCLEAFNFVQIFFTELKSSRKIYIAVS